MLTLHAGAFLFGDAANMAVADGVASDHGFRTVPVDYPLGDLPGAIAEAERIAVEHCRTPAGVYAYGESAGGTLAALLAQRGLVCASATYSPIPFIRDLIDNAPDPEFFRSALKATNLEVEASSPGSRQSSNPILALMPKMNYEYLNRSIRRWCEADPGVVMVEVRGGHVRSAPEAYEENVHRAIAWLADCAGLQP